MPTCEWYQLDIRIVHERGLQGSIYIVVKLKLIIKIFASWNRPLAGIWSPVCKWGAILTDTVPMHRDIVGRRAVVYSASQMV